MLREILNVRQIEDEGHRRWFLDENIDLIVWYSEKELIDGFQICYDKLAVQRTITFRLDKERAHISSDGHFSPQRVLRLMSQCCDRIPHEINALVQHHLHDLTLKVSQ